MLNAEPKAAGPHCRYGVEKPKQLTPRRKVREDPLSGVPFFPLRPLRTLRLGVKPGRPFINKAPASEGNGIELGGMLRLPSELSVKSGKLFGVRCTRQMQCIGEVKALLKPI